MTIRVILADDHRMFREALRGPLGAEPDIDIIGEAGTGADALAALDQACPDILVLDIGLGDINGIDVARTATRRHPCLRIVALSGFAERIYVEEMLKAGAFGYVLKSAGAAELIAAIRTVAAGHHFLSPELTQIMISHIQADGKATAPPPSVLCKREREVLGLIAQGKRSAEIAAHLGIAVATAEVHRRNIKQKLGINTIADLTRYAIHQGMITS